MDLGPALPTHIVQIYLVHFQRNYHWVIVEANHPEYTSTMSHTHTQMMHVCYHIYIHCILSVYIYIYIILHGPRATSSQIICRMNMQYSNCCQGISIISLHRCMNVACTCGNVWHYELNIGNIGQKL